MVRVEVFSLGSLQVYTVQTSEDAALGIQATNFYWRDPSSPQGYGPFAHLSTAMRHHVSILNAMAGKISIEDKTGNVKIINTVIPVDFRAKKRLK